MSDKNTGFVPGLITFLAFIIFFGGILWLSGRSIILSEDYRYFFDFPDVVGLHDKAPVYLRGYQVGWTKNVKFREDVVRVTVDIKREFKIPEDSSVDITTLNFIGEKAITIKPGKSKTPLKPGAVISGENKDIMTMAQDILFTAKKKVEKSDLNQLIQSVTDSTSLVLDVFKKMKAQMGKLDVESYNKQIERLGQASLELKDFMTSVKQDTSQLSLNGRESMNKFKKSLDRIDKTLGQISELSSEVKTLTQSLNSGEGTLGELVRNKEFFINLNHTLDKLNAFLADIKKNPKKYVKFSIF